MTYAIETDMTFPAPLFDDKDHAPTPWRRASRPDEESSCLYDAKDEKVCRVPGNQWKRDQIMDALIALSEGKPAPRSLGVFFPPPWSRAAGIYDAAGQQVLGMSSTRGDTYWEIDVANQIIALVNANER